MNRSLFFIISIIFSGSYILSFDYELAIIGSGYDALYAAHIADSMQKKTVLIVQEQLDDIPMSFAHDLQWDLLHQYVQNITPIHTSKKIPPSPCVSQNILSTIKNQYQQWHQKTLIDLSEKRHITVIEDNPQIINAYTVAFKHTKIHAKYILCATGSHSRIPHIHGIDKVPYTTHETFFLSNELPSSMIILGGDSHALEAASAISALGTKVTLLIPHAVLLPTFDFELVEQLIKHLISLNILIICNSNPVSVEYDGNTIEITVRNKAYEAQTYRAHGLHIAIDNVPASKELTAAGIKCISSTGHKEGPHRQYERISSCNSIQINHFLQTTKPNIYAIGNVTGTHTISNSACYQAAIAIHNMFCNSTEKIIAQYSSLPQIIRSPYKTVMTLGLSEQEAQRIFDGKIDIYYPHKYYDGLQAPFIKLICTYAGTIIGIHLIAHNADEIIPCFKLTDQLNLIHTNNTKHSLLASSLYNMIYAVSVACAQNVLQHSS